MTIIDTIELLKPLEAPHVTATGVRHGFFMADAVRAIGSLAKASNSLAVLLAEGLVESEPVHILDDVHTLYRVARASPPTVH